MIAVSFVDERFHTADDILSRFAAILGRIDDLTGGVVPIVMFDFDP